MPAGVTWPVYLRAVAAGLASMFAGSQLVHGYYKPLHDFETLIAEERQNLREEAEALRAQDEKNGVADED